MTTGWQKVRLEEVLRRSEEILVEPKLDRQYREVTVRLWGKGVVLRRLVMGADLTVSRRTVARRDQFILSRIDARNGALGIVPQELDGAIISSDFPTYEIDRDRVHPQYLGWMCRTASFIEICQRASEGTTNRVRLKEAAFLSTLIPLPTLAEQRRLVVRIEHLAAKIHEAQMLRAQVLESVEVLSASLLIALLPQKIEPRYLYEVVDPTTKISYGVLVPGPEVDDGVPFVRVQDLDLTNPSAHPNKRIAREVEAKYSRTRLRGGEILIGVVGSIGKVGIAPTSWAGANIARAVCRIVPSSQIDRDYLALVLSARPSQNYFRESTRTLAQPTLNVAQLARTPIPVPPLPEQRRIVVALHALQREVAMLTCLQSQTGAELDALVPAILDRAFKGEL